MNDDDFGCMADQLLALGNEQVDALVLRLQEVDRRITRLNAAYDEVLAYAALVRESIDKPYRVQLTHREVRAAADEGVYRHVSSRWKGHRDQLPDGADSWGANIEGAIAEKAASVILNLTWHQTEYGAAKSDIGAHTQVRSIKHPNHRLIVHPTDNNDQPFVLVLYDRKTWTCECIGWLFGADAKRDEWWSNPTEQLGRGAYFVPRDALSAMWTFVDELADDA